MKVAPAVLVLWALLCAIPPGAQAYSGLAPTTGFVWPLAPRPVVVTRFDPPAQRWGSGHRGVDLAAPEGAVVRAAGAGRVVFADAVDGVGSVSVEHDNGLRTTYQPLVASVRPGERVAAGEPIGRLLPGHPGCPEAACLHWGLKLGHGHGDRYYNPLVLVAELPIRLKPMSGMGESASAP